jgi:hypothetical protein
MRFGRTATRKGNERGPLLTVALLLVLIGSGVCAAQGGEPYQLTPLRTEKYLAHGAPAEMTFLEFRNTASKALLGFVMITKYRPKETRGPASLAIVLRVDTDGTVNPLPPGGAFEVLQRHGPLMEESSHSIDLIVYADGSTWGAAKSPAALRLLERLRNLGLIPSASPALEQPNSNNGK